MLRKRDAGLIMFVLIVAALAAAFLSVACTGQPLTPEERAAIKSVGVGAATAVFGPLGGLVADHSIELILAGWMTLRSATAKKRYATALRSPPRPARAAT